MNPTFKSGVTRPRVVPFLLAVAMLPCIGLACSGAPGNPVDEDGYASLRRIEGEALPRISVAASADHGYDADDPTEGAYGGRGDGAEMPGRSNPISPGTAPYTDRLEEIRRAAATAASLRVRPGTVTMMGEGTVRVEPDAATLRFGIVTEDHAASAAMTRNAATSQSIRDALQKAGLKSEEISTQLITLAPLRAPSKYRARNIVAVEIGALKDRRPAFLGDLVGSAVDAGATEVSGPDFKVIDDARPVAAARKAAVEDALVKAATFAHGLGVKLGRIVQIRENGDAGELVRGQGMRMASTAAVSGGPREVSSRVTVVWELQ